MQTYSIKRTKDSSLTPANSGSPNPSHDNCRLHDQNGQFGRGVLQKHVCNFHMSAGNSMQIRQLHEHMEQTSYLLHPLAADIAAQHKAGDKAAQRRHHASRNVDSQVEGRLLLCKQSVGSIITSNWHRAGRSNIAAAGAPKQYCPSTTSARKLRARSVTATSRNSPIDCDVPSFGWLSNAPQRQGLPGCAGRHLPEGHNPRRMLHSRAQRTQ